MESYLVKLLISDPFIYLLGKGSKEVLSNPFDVEPFVSLEGIKPFAPGLALIQ